jgi:hypothetical protein
LEWWNVNLHNEGHNLNENQGNIDVIRSGALPNMNIDNSSIFQSTPYGKGVIICNKNQNILRENMNINTNKNEIREPNSIPKRSDFFDITLQGMFCFICYIFPSHEYIFLIDFILCLCRSGCSVLVWR